MNIKETELINEKKDDIISLMEQEWPKMTAEFKKGLMWAKPGEVAEKIVRAVEKRKSEIYVPGFWRIIMLIIMVIPNKLFRRIKF